MWYGFLFYLVSFVLVFFFIFFYFRIVFIGKLNKKGYFSFTIKIFLIFVNFIFFYSMLTLYNIFYDFENLFFSNLYDTFLFDYRICNNLANHNGLAFQLAYVYYFPFIYIFILITVLSILFCLAYSANEVISFSFYCIIILIAGYSLFFSDSIIFFFFSYEMLLIPSFFILYRFAKTRRCVEAAYLMFF
jgi:hypothetical protein